MVHVVNGQSRVEYPIGKVLYQTSGWISDLRFSPKGDHLAFIDHNLLGDDGGIVSAVDLNGKKSDLTERWASVLGAAWSPSGDEIWFTATATGFSRSLRGVTLSGKGRELLSAPGNPYSPRCRSGRARFDLARCPARRGHRPGAR